MTQAKLFYAPMHYLKKWHIDYNPDAAGNQLPYIDQVLINIVDSEIYHLKAISGEADMSATHTNLTNYTLYKENEKSGDYRVIEWPGVWGSMATLIINGTAEDPPMRAILSDIRFRRALSTAINREEINKVLFYGLPVPRQVALVPDTSFHKPEWGEEHPYAQFDPDTANELLDEMGLDKRSKDGFRLRPDGKELLLVIEYSRADIVAILELVKEHWESVGVKTLIKFEGGGLVWERAEGNLTEVMALGGPNFPPCLERNAFQWGAWMGWSDLGFGGPWVAWLNAKQQQVLKEIGTDAALPPDWRRMETNEEEPLPGEVPPEEVIQWFELHDQWIQADFGSRQYREIGEKLFDFHAEQLIYIGTVGLAPHIWIAKNRLRGLPTPDQVPLLPIDMMMTGRYDQFYFVE